jgi:hypothetical protein
VLKVDPATTDDRRPTTDEMDETTFTISCSGPLVSSCHRKYGSFNDDYGYRGYTDSAFLVTKKTDDNCPRRDDGLGTPKSLLVKGMKVGPSIPYSELTIGVLKENQRGENRVSLAPSNVRTLVDAGLKVVVESGGE